MMAAAWAGAALFAAALGTFGYCYLVVFGRPAPPGAGGVPAVAIDLALFTLFAAHHSLLARAGAKRLVTRIVPPALERTTYVVVASLLFLGVCLLWQRLPGIAWEAAGPWRWAGRLAQLAGLVLVLSAASRIDVWELAGVRQAAAAPPAARGIEHSGPFGWVRHPIYLGWVLLVFGAPVMTASRLLFACVSTAYLVLAIPFEERSLAQAFGSAYDDYRARVRWRLVPGIW